MGQGKGFGKTILIGEHFVVYCLPAIASALGNATIATVEKSERFKLLDKRPEIPGYKKTKKEEIQRQLEALLKHFNLEKEGNSVKIELAGDLECSSGVGASAALAASIVRAISKEFGLGLNEEQVNQAAYKAEEAGSGTP